MGLYLLTVYMSLIFVVNSMMFLPGIEENPSGALTASRDKNVLDNMTSWITNDTIKMYVYAHLLYCPNQDMCFGEEYQRKVSVSYNDGIFRSCSFCGCNDNCHRKKNCCPWRNYKQIISTTPQFITYVDHSSSSTNRYDTVALDCISPTLNLLLKQKYFMVSKCPTSFADEIIFKKCQNLVNETDLKLFQPVTSLETNETFRNIYCAICNGENSKLLSFWKPMLNCRFQSDLMVTTSTETLSSQTSQCGVEFIPPPLIAKEIRNRCYTDNQYINRCNDTGLWQTYDSRIERGCNLDFIDIYTYCEQNQRSNQLKYKNIFCAMCNVGNWTSDLNTECEKNYFLDENHMKSFSALIDFSEFEKTIPNKNGQCPVYDPLLKTCHRPYCGEGLRYEDLDCVPAHSQLSYHKYEINVGFTLKPGRKQHSLESVFSIIRYIHSNQSIDDKICQLFIFSETDAIETYVTDYSLMIHAELYYDHLHNYKVVLDSLSEYFKFDDVVENDLEVAVYSQSFKSLYHTSFTSYFRNPITGNDLYVFSKFIATNKFEECKNHPNIPSTIIAPVTSCPKILIDKRQTTVVVSGSLLCFVDFEFCMESSYFKESRDRSKVEVCVEQYFEKVELVLSKRKLSMEKITSLVCLSLSSVGCIGTIVAYSIFDTGRHVHAMNIKALCVTLIFANSLFSVSGLSAFNPFLCQIVGVLNHFLWLSVVMWMLVSSFTYFQTFTYIMFQSQDNIQKRFSLNVVYSLTFPSCMVLTNMLVSKLLFHDSNYGYSPITCFISLKDMLLYTFMVPIACMVILNIFMILLSFREISKKDDTHFELKTKNDRNMLLIFFRLVAISGTTWLFGFLHIMFPNPLFSYLHIFLASSQGVFLFFAFGIQLVARNINAPKKILYDINGC